MDHEDFALDNNPPNNASDFIFPDPVFTVVRSGLGSRYVLVIDVSGSMSDVSIINLYLQFQLTFGRELFIKTDIDCVTG